MGPRSNNGYDVDGVMQVLEGSVNGRSAAFVAKANRVSDALDPATDFQVYPNPATEQLWL